EEVVGALVIDDRRVSAGAVRYAAIDLLEIVAVIDIDGVCVGALLGLRRRRQCDQADERGADSAKLRTHVSPQRKKEGDVSVPLPMTAGRSECELGADLEILSLTGNAGKVRIPRGTATAGIVVASAGPQGVDAIDEIERIQRLEVDRQLLFAIPRHLE